MASGWLECIYHCKPLQCVGHVTGHSTMVPDLIVPPCSERAELIHYAKPSMSAATPNSPQHPLTRMWVGPHSGLENLVMGKISCPYQESNHDYLNYLAQLLQ